MKIGVCTMFCWVRKAVFKVFVKILICNIGLQPMIGRHTGDNITEYVLDVKKRFGISKGK